MQGERRQTARPLLAIRQLGRHTLKKLTFLSPSHCQGHAISQWNNEPKNKNQSVRLHPAKSFQMQEEILSSTAFAQSAFSGWVRSQEGRTEEQSVSTTSQSPGSTGGVRTRACPCRRTTVLGGRAGHGHSAVTSEEGLPAQPAGPSSLQGRHQSRGHGCPDSASVAALKVQSEACVWR